jgi:ABC-type lipoprotein export system ATPase subunit
MLSKGIKNQILRGIIGSDGFLGKYNEYDGILTFLSKIWSLKEMPSTDNRFKTAYEDIHQHIVNNSDWDYTYLFNERLGLIDADESVFIKFLETVVNPTVRENKEDIQKYVVLINTTLQTTNFRLILSDYFEDLPVYKYRESGEITDLPLDILENKIPFYFNWTSQKEYPSFTLVADNWDDYTFKTTFNLNFYPSQGDRRILGTLKIMKRGVQRTSDVLPERFTTLTRDFCSLGQTKKYYLELKQLLGSNFSSVLLALRDVAIFPKINEQFENERIYGTSLIRYDDSERLVRTVRYEIEGISPNEYYKFNFINQPPYSETPIALNFDFEYNTDYEHRIYALIGKNGTGKTRILASLAKSLSEKEPKTFTPRKPVYGKVFTVSYSYFDRFEIPSSDASFNYVYCGLKKSNGSLKNETELEESFYSAANRIRGRGRNGELVNDWLAILENFLPSEVIQNLTFKNVAISDSETKSLFDIDKFKSVKSILSSGQNIILYMVTEILSHIRSDSLILYDEPETHLHPNAISSLMNSLFDLVERFHSFCVIATHSPLIIQEIPARNIFVIEREGNAASVRALERESLGENLTVITQDIFGNGEVPRNFIKSIQVLLSKGKSFDEIVQILESDNIPMTSNIKLYIKALQLSNEKS